MHPQTHYGHFIAAVELFTGIFSMSLMTGLIFARFARPNARLLFADHPVVSNHEGKPTLMVRFANERHNIIGNATAKLWLMRNEMSLKLGAASASLVVVVSGYDVVAAQTVHARKSYDHSEIRFGHRYADILDNSEEGRLKINYGRFHETLEG